MSRDGFAPALGTMAMLMACARDPSAGERTPGVVHVAPGLAQYESVLVAHGTAWLDENAAIADVSPSGAFVVGENARAVVAFRDADGDRRLSPWEDVSVPCERQDGSWTCDLIDDRVIVRHVAAGDATPTSAPPGHSLGS